MIKRCVSLSLAVLLLAMLTAPALAAGGDPPVTSTGTLWSYLAGKAPGVLGTLVGIAAPSACSVSEDGRHHGKVIMPNRDPGSWRARCDLCSQLFTVYDDDMQKAYEGHVGDMQTQYGSTTINSSGELIVFLDGWTYTPNEYDLFLETRTEYPFLQYLHSTSGRYRIDMRSATLKLPVSGQYRFCFPSLRGPLGSYFIQFTMHNSMTGKDSLVHNYDVADTAAVGNDGYLTGTYSLVGNSDVIAYFVLVGYVPPYYSSTGPYTVYTHSRPYLAYESGLVSPITADTRVGTFSGNFGYYGDNGQMVLAENISIVNETNNTFHNPVTGDTAPVSSWTYDYGDRSYDITLDSGDTVTVTYGDENVTIVQGGNTYNVYYIVEQGGGEPEPTPTPPPTPTPTPPVPTPTVPPGPEPTEPVDPDAPPDTSGWGILDFLKGIFDFLFGLVKKILDGLSALIQNLLQPSEESINKLQSQIEEKLPFISDLKGFGDDFANALKNPLLSAADNQYTTVVDIGAKKGGVSYGTGQVNLLDVSWYLEYKPLGDAIIEGVCWLSFLWNLYGAVPGIIHGAASGVYSTGEIKRWKDGHEE